MTIDACFLDMDGVINDAAQLPQQWDRYMGEILAPRLGRSVEDWGRANRAVFPGVSARNEEWGMDPSVRTRREAVEIIGAMCDHLEMPRPRDARSQEIWLAVGIHIARQGSAIFPGARAALETLASRYALHTATGNASWQVEAHFESMDARQLLGVPAGPDLVGIWKQSPEFYDRLFVLADATPDRAVVVDDGADQLRLAASKGARTILVDAAAGRSRADFDAVIRVIDELPATVEALAAR